MKSKAVFSLLFAIVVYSKITIAQNQNVLDSLINVSKTLKDTSQANVYIEICQNSLDIRPQAAYEYANKLIQFGNSSSNSKYSVRGNEVIGIYHFINSDLDSSLFYIEKAKTIAHQNKLYQKEARLYFRMSFIYVAKSDDEKSIESILKAIEIEQSKTSKTCLSEYKNKLGSIFLAKKDYVNASKYFNEAIVDDRFNPVTALGFIYQNLAWMAKEQNDYQKSFQYLRKSNFYLLEQKEYRALTGNYNTFYVNFINLNQLDSANYYNKKYKEYAKICSMESCIFISHINNSLLNLVYFKNNRLAKMYLDSAAFDTVILQMPEYRLGFWEQKFLFEIATGDFKNGYLHYNVFLRLKDSLLSNENINIVQNLNVKYETEKKELQIKSQSFEIETKEKQNKQKSLIILFGGLTLGVTVFFAVLAFINYRKTKKASLIIENQKAEVELKNKEISHQKELVEEKQKEIIDSITYARRIQHAVLTGEDVWKKISKDYFILFKPKDIVSGDFYWAYNTPTGRSVFVLADCTGHGVPGGFMSMLGNSFLNEIVVENKIFKASEILNKLRAKIIAALEQKGQSEQQKDGMDLSLCVWNKLDNTLEFSGANNPIWILREGTITEYKADKMPIGLYAGNEQPFSSTQITLQKGDIIFLSTDGYADQFGGPKGKKLKYKTMLELFEMHAHEPMSDLGLALEKAFSDWKADYDQVDDVSIIGIRV